MKNWIGKILGLAALCFAGWMLYLHRRLIVAAIKGEERPKAPKGCPAYREE